MGERKYEEFRYEGKYGRELVEGCTSIYKATYICVCVYTHTHTRTAEWREINTQAGQKEVLYMSAYSVYIVYMSQLKRI